MQTYSQTLRLRNADVDLYRRLRLSRLLTWMQEAAICCLRQLGAGKERTVDRGFLWVVALQRADVTRLPVYDETVTLSVWLAGKGSGLFPLSFAMTDAAGQTILTAGALWVLMDRDSRTLAFPDRHGILLQGERTGQEGPMPRPVPEEPAPETRSFTVPYSWVDCNGHMNNARYCDLAEDLLPASVRALPLRRLQVEHCAEARLDQTLRVRLGWSEGHVFLQGEGGKPVFRMTLDYDASKEF